MESSINHWIIKTIKSKIMIRLGLPIENQFVTQNLLNIIISQVILEYNTNVQAIQIIVYCRTNDEFSNSLRMC